MSARFDVRHHDRLLVEQPADIVEPLVGGELDQPLEQAEFGEQRAVFELRKDAKEFEAMFVANPHRDRHRHYPAENGRPEGHHEALVRLAEDDEFVAGLHAAALQGTQQRQRAVVDLAESQRGFVGFSVDEANAAIALTRVAEKVRQRVVEFHATPCVLSRSGGCPQPSAG